MVRLFAVLAVLGLSGPAWSQGMDSTPAERDLMVIAEMLPGIYDNREQVYFDRRTGVREEAQHERLHSVITRVDLPAFGDDVFFVQDSRDDKRDTPYRLRLYSLSADNDERAVRMKIWYLEGEENLAKYTGAHLKPEVLQDRTPENTFILEGCDIFWRREAAQSHGAMKDKTCRWKWPGKGEVYTD